MLQNRAGDAAFAGTMSDLHDAMRAVHAGG